jgi:putative chitinase
MSLKSLQEKIGVTADGLFGKGTITAAMKYYDMSPERAAHFFAQTAHESGNFKAFSENLNYGAAGLRSVFGKYFPTDELAAEYERQPEKIANRVYANRMSNGDEASGDGWKYRGRGALQLTGKANYQEFADYIKDQNVMLDPELVATDYSFESAIFFFEKNGLWKICDEGLSEDTIVKLTKRINGGTHGLQDRIEKTKKFADMLADAN